jgi:hypothetical protein
VPFRRVRSSASAAAISSAVASSTMFFSPLALTVSGSTFRRLQNRYTFAMTS